METKSKWKKDGNNLVKKTDKGTVTIYFPHIEKFRTKQRDKCSLYLYRKSKKYPSWVIEFLDDELLSQAIEKKKIKVTIEIED